MTDALKILILGTIISALFLSLFVMAKIDWLGWLMTKMQ
jgi:hypothetical protein